MAAQALSTFLKASELVPGEVISGLVYWTVIETYPAEGKTLVKDNNGQQVIVDNAIMERQMTSSLQFDSEEKVKRSELNGQVQKHRI
jgi:hypothetical protein